VPLGLWAGIAGKTSTPPPTGRFLPCTRSFRHNGQMVSPAYPAIEPGPGGHIQLAERLLAWLYGCCAARGLGLIRPSSPCFN
jgi:hypothetical protein